MQHALLLDESSINLIIIPLKYLNYYYFENLRIPKYRSTYILYILKSLFISKHRNVVTLLLLRKNIPTPKNTPACYAFHIANSCIIAYSYSNNRK